MAVLNIDALQPARSIVQLALNHYGSDDLFQQLLSFDSVLEALKKIIDRLEDNLKDISKDSTRSSAEYRARYKELEDINVFAFKIADLQVVARKNFNQRARKLRGSTIRRFPYDLPDELLLKVVNYFETTFDETSLRFDSEFPVNTKTIQSLRLTCHRLCEISSPFLVPYIHVAPSVLSLDHVKRVTSHPTISRGLRRIFVNMAVLVAEYAENFQSFSYNRHHRLENVDKFYDEENETLGHVLGKWDIGKKPFQFSGFGNRVFDVGEIFKSLMPSYYEEPPDDDYEWDPDAFDSGELDLNPDLYDEMRDGLDESQIALWEMLQREHARYRELYEEQKTILQGGELTRTVAAATARGRSSISLYISDAHKDPVHGDPFGLVQALRKHGDRDVDHDFVIRFIGMREGQQWEWGDLTQAPQSALYELPLACSAAGANLTELVVDTSTIWSDSRTSLDMTQEQTSALEHISRSLKTFKCHINGCDDKSNLLKYLSAVTGSQMIANLSLDLGFINRRQHAWKVVSPPNPSSLSSPCVLGPLRLSETWENLETLSLKRYSVHLNELEKLLSVLKPGVRIALDQITLLSGTWAEVLDRMHLKVGPDSKITDAQGSEADVMSYRVCQLMLGDTGFTNWATRFICSGEGVRNPLHHLDEFTEILEAMAGRLWRFKGDRGELFSEFQRRLLSVARKLP